LLCKIRYNILIFVEIGDHLSYSVKYNTIQYNTIQCSSAQSTKYGRLCITMSVNEWDNT